MWVLILIVLMVFGDDSQTCKTDVAKSDQGDESSGEGGVNSEFGTLRRVLVGRADRFRLHALETDPMTDDWIGIYLEDWGLGWIHQFGLLHLPIIGRLFTSSLMPKYFGKEYPKEVLDEQNESLEKLVKIFENAGVEVVRPEKGFPNPNNHVKSVGGRGYSPRDTMLQVGREMFLSPMVQISRSTEAEDCFPEILEEYQSRDALVDLRTDEYWKAFNSPDSFKVGEESQERENMRDLKRRAKLLGMDEKFVNAIPDVPPSIFTEKIPLFDFANIIFLNENTLIYMISIGGNWHGFIHLAEVMKSRNINVLPFHKHDYLHGLHIDTTLLVLNKEKIMYNSDRMTLDDVHELCKDHGYPDKKKNYIQVDSADMTMPKLFDPTMMLSSVYMGFNLLALDPNTLIIDEIQIKLIKKLESHGLKVLTVPMPHSIPMMGGVHCVTMPLDRDPVV